MIELELTYLARELPKGLKDCRFKEIIDIYIPKEARHPVLRLRKNGDRMVMTKKQPVDDKDKSRQEEQTIVLTQEEFNTLNKIEGKRVRKLRYIYDYNGRKAEFDVFQDELLGLVVIDFEFDTVEEKASFQMPDFCMADITQEEFVAGGMICGKTYKDIEDNLKKYSYKKLFL